MLHTPSYSSSGGGGTTLLHSGDKLSSISYSRAGDWRSRSTERTGRVHAAAAQNSRQLLLSQSQPLDELKAELKNVASASPTQFLPPSFQKLRDELFPAKHQIVERLKDEVVGTSLRGLVVPCHDSSS